MIFNSPRLSIRKHKSYRNSLALSLECACEYRIRSNLFLSERCCPALHLHLLTTDPPTTPPSVPCSSHTSPQCNSPNLTTLLPRATRSSNQLSSGCIQSPRPYHPWYKPNNSSLPTFLVPVYFAQRIPSLLKTKPTDPLLHSLLPLSSPTKTLRS